LLNPANKQTNKVVKT